MENKNKLKKFDKLIKNKLKNYVYVYRDPFDNKPFYIGKGTGNRCFSHLNSKNESKDKVKKINEIRRKGREPQIDILAFGLDAKGALKVESAAIDLIGIENLTNEQKGHGSKKFGNKSINEIISTNCDEISIQDIKVKGILITVNKKFSYDMNRFELYERTRSCWKLKENKLNEIEYVFALHGNIIVEIYKVAAWMPQNSTMLSYRYTSERPPEVTKKRFEFVGNIAEEKIRKKYLLKTIRDYRSYGNPITYLKI